MLHQSKFGEDLKRNITFGPFTVSPNTKKQVFFYLSDFDLLYESNQFHQIL